MMDVLVGGTRATIVSVIVIVVIDRDFGIIHFIFFFASHFFIHFFGLDRTLGRPERLFGILIGPLVLENVAVRRRGDGGKDW